MPPSRIMFAGGGTGGHLFPAIAIADEIKKLEPTAEILFVGTKDKLEARVVPQRGYAFRSIWISGFHRSVRLSNFLFPVKVLIAFMQSRSIIQQFKPDVVVGTGGYVSGPVLRAAAMLKIPTVIQEQNSYPGVTTRMLAQRAHEVYLSFEESRKYFKRSDNLMVTGNPTRDSLEHVNRDEAFTYFGFDRKPEKKTLLVFGGSLGAHTINHAVEESLDGLLKHNVRVIWQTGKEDLVGMQQYTKNFSSRDVWVDAFIDRMDLAYAVSDAVVCRAGATTIAELTRLGKPAILVPYPHAAANHQVENARTLALVGAAEVIGDHELSEKLLMSALSLLEEGRLKRMAQQCKMLGKSNASGEIAKRVLRLARESQAHTAG